MTNFSTGSKVVMRQKLVVVIDEFQLIAKKGCLFYGEH